MSGYATIDGKTYKVVYVEVGTNAPRNATLSAKAARKRWDDKYYKVVAAQLEKPTAANFKRICEREGITVNAGIKALITKAIAEDAVQA